MADSMLRRALLLGIGALSWSRERVETLVDDLVQHGQLDGSEREHMVDDLLERGRRNEESLRAFVAEQVARGVRALPMVTKDDLAQLEARLRAEMATLRRQDPGGAD